MWKTLKESAEDAARQIQTSLKSGSASKIQKSVRAYTCYVKDWIFFAFLRGKDEERALEEASQLQERLKSNFAPLDPDLSKPISDVDLLLKEASNGNLDYIVALAIKKDSLQEQLMATLPTVGRKEIKDLAEELGYTLESTRKLVQKSVDIGLLKGVLTLDSEAFVSHEALRRGIMHAFEEECRDASDLWKSPDLRVQVHAAASFLRKHDYKSAADVYLTIYNKLEKHVTDEHRQDLLILTIETFIVMSLAEECNEKQREKVLENLEELARDELEQPGDEEFKAQILADLVLVHLLAEKYEKAAHEMKKAITLLKKLDAHAHFHSLPEHCEVLSGLLIGDISHVRKKIKSLVYTSSDSMYRAAYEKLAKRRR